MLKARLRQCAERVGNGATLARKTGIPRRTLETYLSGSAEPKASRLADIALAAGVSGHWLLTGEGRPSGDEEDGLAEFVAIRPRATGGPVTHAPEEGPGLEGARRIHFDQRWLQSHGWHYSDLRLVESRGDCMVPTVRDGALTLVDVSVDRLREEGVYVLEVQGMLLVRRIQFDVEGGIIATSDNPAYREQYLRQQSDDELTVFGKVVWVGNPLE